MGTPQPQLHVFPLVFVLVVLSLLAPTRSNNIADLLYDDSSTLKKELEAHSMKLLRNAKDLIDFGLFPEAEERMRSAISTAPWLPMAYDILGSHLMDQGEQKQIREIIDLFRRSMRINHALPPPNTGVGAEDLMKQLHKRPSFKEHFVGKAFPARIRHDRDQLALLRERGRLPQSLVDRYLRGYDQLLAQIPEEHNMHQLTIPASFWAKTIGSVYQRALYVPEIEPLKGPALNPNLDFAAIEEQYLSADPNFAYFDNFLTEEALLKLRTYYEEGTVFWEDKHGYVGSYLLDGGFGNIIIAQIVEELIDAFPRLICDHRLNNAWAYKYDSEFQTPIAVHADIAAVNFNFWLSPDEGSLDKKSGGLVVYKAVPPEGTPMEVFNRYPLHENVTRMLEETNHANFTVPYKSNRAVVFQSSLFHESGKMNGWAAGYTKRRLNLTYLFGKMYGKCGDGVKSGDERVFSEPEQGGEEL